MQSTCTASRADGTQQTMYVRMSGVHAHTMAVLQGKETAAHAPASICALARWMQQLLRRPSACCCNVRVRVSRCLNSKGSAADVRLIGGARSSPFPPHCAQHLARAHLAAAIAWQQHVVAGAIRSGTAVDAGLGVGGWQAGADRRTVGAWARAAGQAGGTESGGRAC